MVADISTFLCAIGVLGAGVEEEWKEILYFSEEPGRKATMEDGRWFFDFSEEPGLKKRSGDKFEALLLKDHFGPLPCLLAFSFSPSPPEKSEILPPPSTKFETMT